MSSVKTRIRISRHHLIELLSGAAGEIAIYILWRVLGLFPDWLAYVALAGVLVILALVYFFYHPNEEERGQIPVTEPTRFGYARDDRDSRPFEVGIDSNAYQLGDTVTFRASFDGFLNHGFFTVHILASDSRDWWERDHKTLFNTHQATMGELHGNRIHKGLWRWQIPKDWPTGRYDFSIFVADRKKHSFLSELFDRYVQEKKHYRRYDPLRYKDWQRCETVSAEVLPISEKGSV